MRMHVCVCVVCGVCDAVNNHTKGCIQVKQTIGPKIEFELENVWVGLLSVWATPCLKLRWDTRGKKRETEGKLYRIHFTASSQVRLFRGTKFALSLSTFRVSFKSETLSICATSLSHFALSLSLQGWPSVTCSSGISFTSAPSFEKSAHIFFLSLFSLPVLIASFQLNFVHLRGREILLKMSFFNTFQKKLASFGCEISIKSWNSLQFMKIWQKYDDDGEFLFRCFLTATFCSNSTHFWALFILSPLFTLSTRDRISLATWLMWQHFLPQMDFSFAPPAADSTRKFFLPFVQLHFPVSVDPGT